ncbi:MAG: 2OG-Fe(II) oxygenase [Comamonas sp.]
MKDQDTTLPATQLASSLLNISAIQRGLSDIQTSPFTHCVINDFFQPDVAVELANEFDAYDSSNWYVYNNSIEHKKTNNRWIDFPAKTYEAFAYLNSPEFVQLMSDSFDSHLYPDPGLHGGGWHIHGQGGNLNPHLDYSMHPKMGLQRKLNIIIYLSQELNTDNGGHLGLYGNESDERPGELIREVEPIFNRAIIFDTTMNSWHGMSRPLNVPPGIYRKSFAVYYLQPFEGDVNTRSRALFAPREHQKGNTEVLDTIRVRSDAKAFHQAYRTQK